MEQVLLKNAASVRDELVSRIEEIRSLIEYGQTTSSVVELDQTTQGRLSRMDAMQQAALASARLVSLERDLRKYQAAIDRFDEGSYGICCRCGEEIAPARLQNDPGAPFCRDCVEPAE